MSERALTDREKQTLDCVGRGLTNKELATEMGITEGTAKAYVMRVRVKDPMHRNRYAMCQTRLAEQLDAWRVAWQSPMRMMLPACWDELEGILNPPRLPAPPTDPL